jgi:hypothetical protein
MLKIFVDIQLFLCELIQGRYSERYFALVHKYSIAHPRLNNKNKPCFSTEPILRLSNVIIRNPNFPVLKTSKPILFEKIAFDCDTETILREKGGAGCTAFYQHQDKAIQIIGYREHILNAPSRILFYFSRGRFFMGEYLFSEKFSTMSEQLARTISKRYGQVTHSLMEKFYIEDPYGSFLCFHNDGFSLSVKYFNTPSCHILPHLQDVFRRNFSGKPTSDIHSDDQQDLEI